MNIGALLAHIGLEPLVYGAVIAAGLLVILVKIARGNWLSVTVDIAVFYLVFSMHGGTMTGGMAAAVAALICGLILPVIFRRFLS